MHKKVIFNGETYWLHKATWGGFNLSPLDHYTEDGQLTVRADDISYAIVQGDEILRFGNVIGRLNDLINLK